MPNDPWRKKKNRKRDKRRNLASSPHRNPLTSRSILFATVAMQGSFSEPEIGPNWIGSMRGVNEKPFGQAIERAILLSVASQFPLERNGRMASFYRSNVAEFLAVPDEQILARLSSASAAYGYTSQYTDQTLTWERDIRSLRALLLKCTHADPKAADPRKESRIDVVLLATGTPPI